MPSIPPTKQTQAIGHGVPAGQMQEAAQEAYCVVNLRSEAFAQAGLLAGDRLYLQTNATPASGSLVVLKMDGKMLLRQIDQGANGWKIKPIQPSLDTMEWPYHIPLPLVGVVRQVERLL
jgi:SOS-response transcriptional repressor LexA